MAEKKDCKIEWQTIVASNGTLDNHYDLMVENEKKNNITCNKNELVFNRVKDIVYDKLIPKKESINSQFNSIRVIGDKYNLNSKDLLDEFDKKYNEYMAIRSQVSNENITNENKKKLYDARYAAELAYMKVKTAQSDLLRYFNQMQITGNDMRKYIVGINDYIENKKDSNLKNEINKNHKNVIDFYMLSNENTFNDYVNKSNEYLGKIQTGLKSIEDKYKSYITPFANPRSGPLNDLISPIFGAGYAEYISNKSKQPFANLSGKINCNCTSENNMYLLSIIGICLIIFSVVVMAVLILYFFSK